MELTQSTKPTSQRPREILVAAAPDSDGEDQRPGECSRKEPKAGPEAAAERPPSSTCPLQKSIRMAVASLLHGLLTGFVGIFVAVLIREVQIVGFGALGNIDSNSGFLEMAMHAPPWRRLAIVTFAGFFGACAWYWLRGLELAVVSVEESLEGAKMPALVTLANAVVQDVVVALGGSFGREAAPREIAAMLGGTISDAIRVSNEQRRILVAYGTGAGLAAVYSVPVSGVFYSVEHVLQWNVSLGTVAPAIVTSFLATWVASFAVSSQSLYPMPRYSYDWPSSTLLLWSIVIGPLAGMSAVAFRRFVKYAESFRPVPRFPVNFEDAHDGQRVWILQRNELVWKKKEVQVARKEEHSVIICDLGSSGEGKDADIEMDEHEWILCEPEGQRDWRILVIMPAAFLALGVLSHDFPSLLGNGHALAQVAIRREYGVCLLLALMILKALLTSAAIASGAAGGTLTPSVALGATLGAVIGELWQNVAGMALAPTKDDAMSVIAAAAFLAVAMRSPVTALTLLMEFSAQGIAWEDLRTAFLHGDITGIVSSKLALGMLMPTALAVTAATVTVARGEWLGQNLLHLGTRAFASCSHSKDQLAPPPSEKAESSPFLQTDRTSSSQSLPRKLLEQKKKSPSESEQDLELSTQASTLMRSHSKLATSSRTSSKQSSASHSLPGSERHYSSSAEQSSLYRRSGSKPSLSRAGSSLWDFPPASVSHVFLRRRSATFDLDLPDDFESLRQSSELHDRQSFISCDIETAAAQASAPETLAAVHAESHIDDMQGCQSQHVTSRSELLAPMRDDQAAGALISDSERSFLESILLRIAPKSFRIGVRLNSCITLYMAVVMPLACHPSVTKVSKHGALAAFVVGALLSAGELCGAAPMSQREGDRKAVLENHDIEQSQFQTRKSILRWFLCLTSGSLFSAFGAFAPLMPWICHIWDDGEAGKFAAIAASFATSSAACACCAVFDMLQKESLSVFSVFWETLLTVLSALVACLAGSATQPTRLMSFLGCS
eukprot:TRINITY_DN93250_c0_g1_i1.p1 TRINITY_DN93250_c0_g1~~TRINITY_DN93250_c0_g1_i1.p1  ORF type:complete len:1009 (+),score=158.53 TRINITY_DN93250_c0_g1_i1:153-3179(+)